MRTGSLLDCSAFPFVFKTGNLVSFSSEFWVTIREVLSHASDGQWVLRMAGTVLGQPALASSGDSPRDLWGDGFQMLSY